MLLHASHHLLSRVQETVEDHSVRQQELISETSDELSKLRAEHTANKNAMMTLEQRITLLKKRLKTDEEEFRRREEDGHVLRRTMTEKTEMLRSAEVRAERMGNVLDRLSEADVPLADAWEQWQGKVSGLIEHSWPDRYYLLILCALGTQPPDSRRGFCLLERSGF